MIKKEMNRCRYNSECESMHSIVINKMRLNVITVSKLSQNNMFNKFYEIFAMLIHMLNRQLF